MPILNLSSQTPKVADPKGCPLETGRLKVGDVVVIVMGSPVSAAGTTNLIKVQKL